MREKELQGLVAKAAESFGALHYHTFNSRRSPSGFPDSVIIKGTNLIFAELKRERRKPTPTQDIWLEALRNVRSIQVKVWRPSDWIDETIIKTIRGEE